MKRFRALTLLLAVMLIRPYFFPTFTVNANSLPEDASGGLSGGAGSVSGNNSDLLSGEDSAQDPDSVPKDTTDGLSNADPMKESGSAPKDTTDGLSNADPMKESGSAPKDTADGLSDAVSMKESGSAPKGAADGLSKESLAAEIISVSENSLVGLSAEDSWPEADLQALNTKPAFSATIRSLSGSYAVWGHLAEIDPDITLAHPQYSLDGENWQDCDKDCDWDQSRFIEPNEPDELQNYTFLEDRFEPLKSYLAGSVDRFYLRLYITRENGIAYETQAALIERGEAKPLPEAITPAANFSNSMVYRVPGSRLPRIGYQLAISADASSEEIAALLPDTLPVQVDLKEGRSPFASCTIDCPVTWKPILLPELTAGESVTLEDAAEAVIIPSGALLSTPMGRFTLKEPLGIGQDSSLDKVALVLNVVPEDISPAGILDKTNYGSSCYGLSITLDPKPTGATAIRAYTLTEGDTEWKELVGLPLLEAVNSQPASTGSGPVTILDQDQEPYRSYLAAIASGEEPKPFLVGLKIEGGIFNDCQLILAWPDSYDIPPNLLVGGSGGNQGNAGSNNKDDSTEEGQRPNLPQDSSDTANQEQEDSSQNALSIPKEPPTGPTQNVSAGAAVSPASAVQMSTDIPGSQLADSLKVLADAIGNRKADSPDKLVNLFLNQKTDSQDKPVNLFTDQKTDSQDKPVSAFNSRQTGLSSDGMDGPEEQTSLQALLPYSQPGESEPEIQANQEPLSSQDPSGEPQQLSAAATDPAKGKFPLGPFLPAAATTTVCIGITLTVVKGPGKRIFRKNADSH